MGGANKYGFETYKLEGRLKEPTIEIAMESDITVYDAIHNTKLHNTNKTAKHNTIHRRQRTSHKFPNTALHIKQYPKTCSRRE